MAQITAANDADRPQPFQTFTPTKSLSNSVTFNGYTLTLDTNASTQYYGIELSGNGVQAFNKHFGPSAGAGGSSGLPAGVGISVGIANNNNEAIDAITITQNVATATSDSAILVIGRLDLLKLGERRIVVDHVPGQLRNGRDQRAAIGGVGVRAIDLGRLTRIDPFDARLNDGSYWNAASSLRPSGLPHPVTAFQPEPATCPLATSSPARLRRTPAGPIFS